MEPFDCGATVTNVDFHSLGGRQVKSHVNADVKITICTGAVRIVIPPTMRDHDAAAVRASTSVWLPAGEGCSICMP